MRKFIYNREVMIKRRHGDKSKQGKPQQTISFYQKFRTVFKTNPAINKGGLRHAFSKFDLTSRLSDYRRALSTEKIAAFLSIAIVLAVLFYPPLRKQLFSNPSVVNKGDQELSSAVNPVYKSQDDKDRVVQEDLDQMNSLNLYYDYAHLSLEDTVKAFLEEQGLESWQVAFTYKNLETNEVFSMNDTQLMTAGSTYKLPLNMLVVDALDKGKLSSTQAYDISETGYEYKPEHDAYMAKYGGKMTISDMQYGSIVLSENTPAYALADRLGGMDQAYAQFDRYGTSKNPYFPTISMDGNKTTTSYYTQVLDYLYQHQDKYEDLLAFLDQAFPESWYEEHVKGVTVYQKPGYVREALNIDAIVMEETPYSIALYTSGFGGASETDETINGYGYSQVTSLAYVINEWHRVNMNPANETS